MSRRFAGLLAFLPVLAIACTIARAPGARDVLTDM
jgi:hypothetical protein